MSDLPRRIGPWRVHARLGSGGMGTVYLATRRSERAALKVVHPALADDAHFLDRFRREVMISRRVSGPYVATPIDADLEADPPWLAVEYVEGPTLAQRVTTDGPLSVEHTMALALALASGLADIHAAGVIHRDLKPTNVILASRGPVMIDFGIAAALDGTSLTRTGAVIGSSGWMSPEQLRGEPSGTAGDVFAWAATVCFAATGHSPFGTGRADILAYRVAHAEPDLTGLPAELEDVIRRALAKDAAARPTVPQIVDALTGIVDGQRTVVDGTVSDAAVTALWAGGPPSIAPWRPPAAQRRRRPAPLVAAMVAAVLLVAAGAFFLTRGRTGDDAARQEMGAAPEAAPTSERSATSSTTSTTTSTTSTTTSTTTTTTAPPPADPSLERLFDPASDDDIDTFVGFAEAHLQQVVRLQVGWSDPGDADPGAISAEPEWEPGLGIVFVRGPCRDDPFCTGAMQVLLHDLEAVPDAHLYYDSGTWVLSGRFGVQSVTVGTGGIYSVSLRAVPIA